MNTLNYVGIDVSKSELVLSLPEGRPRRHPNTPAGLTALLKTLPVRSHLALEATGGYERLLVQAAHAAAIPVSILNPAHIRHFAQAKGQRAKTDPIDAGMIRQYAQAMAPAPSAAPEPALVCLAELVNARQSLINLRIQLINLLEHACLKTVRSLYQKQLRQIETSLLRLEHNIAARSPLSWAWLPSLATAAKPMANASSPPVALNSDASFTSPLLPSSALPPAPWPPFTNVSASPVNPRKSPSSPPLENSSSSLTPSSNPLC